MPKNIEKNVVNQKRPWESFNLLLIGLILIGFVYGGFSLHGLQKENLALSLGKSFLRYNKIDSLEVVKQHIDSVTPEQLQTIANEIFDPAKLSVLKYV